MPGASSSNAVAALKNGIEVYSLMGVGPKKTWDDITNKMYVLRFKTGKWSEGPPGAGSCRAIGRVGGGRPGAGFSFWRIHGGRAGQ